jgi:hypothetical protein
MGMADVERFANMFKGEPPGPELLPPPAAVPELLPPPTETVIPKEPSLERKEEFLNEFKGKSSGTVIIISDYAPDLRGWRWFWENDEHPEELREPWYTSARKQYGPDVPIIRNVTGVTELGHALSYAKDRSITKLVIGGHGSGGCGISTTTGYIDLKTLKKPENRWVVDMIRQKLAPNAVVELQGCNTGNDRDELKKMAALLGRDVIGVVGYMSEWDQANAWRMATPKGDVYEITAPFVKDGTKVIKVTGSHP